MPNPHPAFGLGKACGANPLPEGEGLSIFLDRDGVINEKLEGDYVKTWEEFKFLPGSVDAIRLLNEKKIPVYIISNQSGVGRGYMSMDDLYGIHGKMAEELKKNGAHVDDIFVCPHSPEDNCECRKPKPGLLHQAKHKYPAIDFKKSWFVGDSDIDMEAGQAVGCKIYLLKKGEDLGRVVQGVSNNE